MNQQKTEREQVINQRLQEAFSPIHLEVIDESDAHIGHAGYQGGARHFAIRIKATCFFALSRIDAHRMIYRELSDMMPDEIHALRIHIMQ